MESSLEQIGEESTPVSLTVLTELSDLSPAELGRFARVWFKASLERKLKVVESLVSVAEDNAELDFSAVLRVCLKDPNDTVREKAISGLWEFEDRSLITVLVELLKSDRSAQVKASAATALGKFATLAQDGKLLSRDGELVKESLMGALRQEDGWPEVRRRALESVAPFNTPDLTQYINWAYGSDDLKLKSSSIYAMGRTGQPKWLDCVFTELQNPSPPIRYEAAHACGGLDQEEAAPHLIPLLQDDDLQVQLAAIVSLGELGGSLAKKALKLCLKRGDSIVEDAAREALENIIALEDPLAFNYEQ